MTPSFELMAPLMFAGLIVVLLIGYPVAFSLSAVGLGFGFLAIQLGYFDFVLLAIQGVAEIIKKYAVATGIREPGKAYERPVQ